MEKGFASAHAGASAGDSSINREVEGFFESLPLPILLNFSDSFKLSDPLLLLLPSSPAISFSI
ncbi:hypothetical protein A2U01_0050831, partial [Trifolium medium]|nr:hypothetical protein [Trifolium medium]